MGTLRPLTGNLTSLKSSKTTKEVKFKQVNPKQRGLGHNPKPPKQG